LEREERAVRVAEMEAEKVSNIMKYKDDIVSRPARGWFMSENEKQKLKAETKNALQEVNTEPTVEQPENNENKSKVYHPPRIPSLKTPQTRRERRKQEDKESLLTPSQFQLAKKKNNAKTQLKRQRSRDGTLPTPKRQKRAPAKPAQKDNKIKAGTPFRIKKKGTSFKSKMKHKRRK